MSVGSGFSASDFVAAIKLVRTVKDALSTSSTSNSELLELFRQLHSLEIALREVKRLEVNETLHAEGIALRQSAAQCQITISEFLNKTESYQPHLLCTSGANETFLSKYKKIKWVLCKKKEVVQFKTDLLAHTESIQLLLTTIQMRNVDLSQKRQQNLQMSILSHIQYSFSSYMRKLSTMSNTLTKVSMQAQECLESGKRILMMNIQVFQIVLDIQKSIHRISTQVEFQQPVILIDSMGRRTPFHLEFITCLEALIEVLSARFKQLGPATKKIRNCEFAIQDSRTQRDIDLNRPWDECFVPGQQTEMSMIFERYNPCKKLCPKCRQTCTVDIGEDLEW